MSYFTNIKRQNDTILIDKWDIISDNGSFTNIINVGFNSVILCVIHFEVRANRKVCKQFVLH